MYAHYSDSDDEESDMETMESMPRMPEPYRSINFAGIWQSVPSTSGSALGQAVSMVLPHPADQQSQATPPAVVVQNSAQQVCKP
jgi:hypothetical protein